MRIDAHGECPVIVRDGDEIAVQPGVRWRFVAEAASDLEACRIVAQLQPEHPES